MPRTKKTNNNILAGHTERVLELQMTSGKVTVSLDPTISSVLTSLSAVYRYYRFTALKVQVFPLTSGVTKTLFQFVAGGGSTGSGAADGFMESKYTNVITRNQAVPSQITISRSDLIQNQPWFITETDATDSYLDSPGALHFEAGTSDIITVRLTIDYEFKFSMATELSFSRLAPERIEPKRALPSKASNAASQTMRGGELYVRAG